MPVDFALTTPSLDAMQTVVVLVLMSGVGIAVFRFRSVAARDRKEVLARLSTEHQERGDYSPTAELFREVGVPVPAEYASALASTAPGLATGTATATGDLTTLFRGIQMPVGLTPLGDLGETTATFSTTATPKEVQSALVQELERIGALAAWPEPSVAQVSRNGVSGLIAIYARPDTVRDLDGAQLFPTASPDSCVVRLTAF